MGNLEKLARFGRQDAGRKTNKINKHDTTQKKMNHQKPGVNLGAR